MDSRKIRKRGISGWMLGRKAAGFQELSQSPTTPEGSSHSDTPFGDRAEKTSVRTQITGAHSATIMSLATWKSESCNYLISGGGDNIVKIWNLSTLELVYNLTGHTNWIRCVASSRDGVSNPIVVSASADKSLIVWDLLSGIIIRTLFGHNLIVSTVAICHDSAYPVIVSGSWDKSIKIWDIETGDMLRTIEAHNSPISCISISGGALPVIISGSEDDVLKVLLIIDS